LYSKDFDLSAQASTRALLSAAFCFALDAGDCFNLKPTNAGTGSEAANASPSAALSTPSALSVPMKLRGRGSVFFRNDADLNIGLASFVATSAKSSIDFGRGRSPRTDAGLSVGLLSSTGAFTPLPAIIWCCPIDLGLGNSAGFFPLPGVGAAAGSMLKSSSNDSPPSLNATLPTDGPFSDGTMLPANKQRRVIVPRQAACNLTTA
jgi:hypothetical protein